MKLRIWHIANPPGETFHRYVKDLDEAKRMLNALAEFDLFVGDAGEFHITVGNRNKARDILTLKYNINADILHNYEMEYLTDPETGIPYCCVNAQGLEVITDGRWEEWTNEDGDDLDEVMKKDDLEFDGYPFENWSRTNLRLKV